MKTATTVAQMLVRGSGVILIVLGVLFWTGNALPLIPVHMLLGLLLVLALWTLALLGARAGVNRGLIILAALWGIVVLILGLRQDSLLVGDAHWIIRVLHLLVGLVAIGLAESIGGMSKRAQASGSPR